MAFEQKDNSGTAFINQKKERDTHADLTGTSMVDGTEYWINVWRKTDRNGNEYLSFSFRKKEQRGAGQSGGGSGGQQRSFGSSKPAGKPADEPNDSIPW